MTLRKPSEYVEHVKEELDHNFNRIASLLTASAKQLGARQHAARLHGSCRPGGRRPAHCSWTSRGARYGRHHRVSYRAHHLSRIATSAGGRRAQEEARLDPRRLCEHRPRRPRLPVSRASAVAGNIGKVHHEDLLGREVGEPSLDVIDVQAQTNKRRCVSSGDELAERRCLVRPLASSRGAQLASKRCQQSKRNNAK